MTRYITLSIATMLSLMALTGCGGSSRNSSVSAHEERAREEAEERAERGRYYGRYLEHDDQLAPDWDVNEAAESANRENATTGFAVAAGTRDAAERNFVGNEALIPYAVAGDKTYPLMLGKDQEGKDVYYLVNMTREGPKAGKIWTGQIIFVHSPRALAAARLGARTADQIERDALNRERQRESNERRKRRDTLNEAKAWVDFGRSFIP